ncbi:hypothetical protein [Pacificoceanicola onchidii]|uniref:hypothetical protein n=1 Tax=Pacificoceanicola onchidii TaxID=2562685 RepID=UPI0010A67F8C|nr:hypothetical protein [Pacificoceanicola onchidii]
MTDMQGRALKGAAVLWIIWGLVHTLAGVMVLFSDATGGFQAIADAVEPAALEAEYHAAVGGVLNQHGWNLGWFGIATILGGILIWRANTTAIWVTGMVGGLADVGYLLFVDFPGYVNFVPGTVMTFISASAIGLSFWVWFANGRGRL